MIKILDGSTWKNILQGAWKHGTMSGRYTRAFDKIESRNSGKK
jgi:hypothetical protein